MQGVRTLLAERHDDELVALARGGDEQAFAELYQRYFRGLYDFSLRMLRDREAASDVVQSTFVKAWSALRGPKGVENVKAWLYAVARNLAIDELRRRQRLASPRSDDDEDPIYTLVDDHRLADPSIAAHDQELVDLVWESAAALSPQEYSLLDLHLRQGLDADELASALGVAKGAVYTRLTRLRDSLDEAVTSSVLMRHAGRECDELAALLERMGATKLTREVKRAINAHVKECDICGETKRRLIAPSELFAGLTLVPIPDGLSDAIWSNISSQLGFSGAAAGTAHGGATQGHGGTGHGSSTATKAKAATALGTLGAVAVIGALLFPRGETIQDPTDVHSTSHRVGQQAVVPVVQMAWSRSSDADAYSVNWTQAPVSEPDAVADLSGDATGATSPALSPGRWWFHLRTRGHGTWTHTVHVGPFILVGSTIRAPLISPSAPATRARVARKRAARIVRAAIVVATAPLGVSTSGGGVAGTSTGGTVGSDDAPPPAAPPNAPGGSTTTTPTPISAPPPPDPVPPVTPDPAPGTATTPTTTTPTTPPPAAAPSQPADKPAPANPELPPDQITVESQVGLASTTPG